MESLSGAPAHAEPACGKQHEERNRADDHDVSPGLVAGNALGSPVQGAGG
jgi:hypothetical protein